MDNLTDVQLGVLLIGLLLPCALALGFIIWDVNRSDDK